MIKFWKKNSKSRQKLYQLSVLNLSSLDEVAPFGVITIRSNFKFGLSDETKDLMKQKEAVRNKIKSSVGNEKQLWIVKYKKLRNTVTSKIRKETIDHNANVWNNAPCAIKECISLSSVKKQIKIYIKTLPI